MAYESVNSLWPAGTREGRDLKPTPEEACAAVRKLWRFATRKGCPYRVAATSGRRRGGIHGGVLYVNPDRGGWHEVVHMVSHYVAWRLHPGSKAHDRKGRHAFIEREMVRHVVESGWLDGKLKRPERPAKPKPDARELRYRRTLAGIKRWEAKARRAKNALRKLQSARKRYERSGLTAEALPT